MQEFLIDEFSGIASAKRIPNINECTELINLDLRNNSGDLVINRGYNLFYNAPSSSINRGKLTNITPLGLATFFIPIINSSSQGQEITTEVVKGNLTVEAGSSLPSENIIGVFIRPYWSGSNWINDWQNLTECYLTTVKSVQSYTIGIDATDTFFLSSSYLRGWTIQNPSRNDYTKIMGCSASSGTTILTLTQLVTGSWQVGDKILIMRDSIPYSFLTGNYNATKNDITFHKVLDSIRIGFGGEQNRLGLSITYQNKYYKFNSSSFASPTDPFYSDTSSFAQLATLNRMTIEPYNIIGTNTLIRADITPFTGSWPAGNYGLRLTSIVDGFQEFMTDNTSFDTSQFVSSFINIIPSIDFGSINPRITQINDYIGSGSSNPDTAEYFLYSQLPVTDTFASWSLNSGRTNQFFLNNSGYLESTFNINSVSQSIEYNITPNCIAPAGLPEAATLDGLSTGNDTVFFSRVSMSVETLDVKVGSYSLSTRKVLPGTNTPSGPGFTLLLPSLPTDGLRQYRIQFWAKIVGNTTDIGNFIQLYQWALSYSDPTETIFFPYQNIITADGWKHFDITVTPVATTSGLSKLNVWYNNINNDGIGTFYIDGFSIAAISQQLQNQLIGGIEMSDNMGYQPTQELVSSWDKGLVAKGKTYTLNTYIDTRLKNKIIFSPATNAAGAFLYDVLTPQNFFDLEAFDGNDCISMEFTPAVDIYVLRKNSIQWIDSDSGVSRHIDIGDGPISKKSIFTFGDTLFYNGIYDVYGVVNANKTPISNETIRDKYRNLTTDEKESTIGIGEKNTHSYRFYAGDSASQYIYTNKGWEELQNGLIPEDLTLDISGSILYMTDSGSIYKEFIDSPQLSTFKWTSVNFDNTLMGSDLPANTRFHVSQLFVRYNATQPFNLNLYILDSSSLTPFQTWTVPTGSDAIYKVRTHLGSDTKRFKLEVTDNNSGLSNNFTLSSIGLLYKVLPTGIR